MSYECYNISINNSIMIVDIIVNQGVQGDRLGHRRGFDVRRRLSF